MVDPAFDDIIHARNRLQICAVLAQVDALAFPILQEALQVSDYVVSKHLKVLIDAGYVATTKERHRGRPQTWASLTASGRAAYQQHLAALHAITNTTPSTGRQG